MTNKTCVIVTGASRGIGAAIAHALALQGRIVICVSRSGDSPAIHGVPDEVSARWRSVKGDVTRSDGLDGAFEAAADQGLAVTGLVNNAGIHLEGRSENFSVDDWNRVMTTNATSVLLCAQAVYPRLIAGGGGLIVNIGSFFDKLGVKRNLAYCASKAAVGAMTRCLAVEWASQRIRVLNVAPGYIHTDLNHDVMTEGPLRDYLSKRIPGGSPGVAEDVGEFVAQLFAQRGSFLTGETLYLDGAQGVAH